MIDLCAGDADLPLKIFRPAGDMQLNAIDEVCPRLICILGGLIVDHRLQERQKDPEVGRILGSTYFVFSTTPTIS